MGIRSIRRRVGVGAIAVVAVLATAGCGGDSKTTTTAGGSATTVAGAPAATPTTSAGSAVTAAPSAATGTGACKYVSTAQASALATSPVKAGEPSSQTDQGVTFNYCKYIFDPGNAPGVLVATVDLGQAGPGGFASFKQEKASGSDFQDVAGIGDEAYFSGENLYVRQGNTGMILFVGRNDGYPRGTDGIPDEKALAAIIIAQL
jgi:hypothetical protein